MGSFRAMWCGARRPDAGGAHCFAGIVGDRADDPDALAAAVGPDWPEFSITRTRESDLVAYDRELGAIWAGGTPVAGVSAAGTAASLGCARRPGRPGGFSPGVRWVVCDDSTATPAEMDPGMKGAALREQVAAVEGRQCG